MITQSSTTLTGSIPSHAVHTASYDKEDMALGLSQSFDESDNSQMSMGMTDMKGDMRVDMMYGHMTGEMDGHMGGYGGQAGAGGDQYYNQQWCSPDYNYYQGYPQHHHQQFMYPQQHQYTHHHQYRGEGADMYGMGGPGGYHHRSDSPMSGYHPPARSPTGSHSTPSPHSQETIGDEMTHLELKRPLEEGGYTIRPTPSMNTQPKKSKPSRRKKKRDPNEPQKPVSAYALFFRDSQASIKNRNPNLTFGDVSKMVASLWDSLDADSKSLYKKRTEMAKKEYLRQLAAYRASLVSKGQGDDMFGFPGGYGYPGLGMGQSIPPHPPSAVPPHPAVSSVTGGTSGQLRNGAGQPLHSPQGHLAGGQAGQTTGTAAQGNNQGYTTHNQDFNNQVSGGSDCTSPPTTTSGQNGSSHMSASGQPQSGYHHGYHGPHGQYDGYHPAGAADRNHNAQTVTNGPSSSGSGSSGSSMTVCGRPGCGRPVSKTGGVDANGVASTNGAGAYCSSECVVGQCREVYTSWAGANGPPGPQGPQAVAVSGGGSMSTNPHAVK